MPYRGRPIWVWLLVAVLGQLAIRALIGGGALLIEPDGSLVGLRTVSLAGTPFVDFRIPGLVLGVAFGLGSLIAIAGLYANRPWAWVVAVAVALAFLGWLFVETRLGFVRPTLYANLATAVAILGLALHPSVRQ